MEPWPGRGVCLAADRRHAEWAARVASVRADVAARETEGLERSEWTACEALIVVADCTGLGAVLVDQGVFDPDCATYLIRSVPRHRITRFERIEVPLSRPGDLVERVILRTGFAREQDGLGCGALLDHLPELIAEGRAQRV